MSDLNDAVCRVLRMIEPGHVATYGDVGRQVGVLPRQAGREVARVPDDVPWWRVVRADGTVATCHEGTAPGLLIGEGVPVKNGRVDLTCMRQEWV